MQIVVLKVGAPAVRRAAHGQQPTAVGTDTTAEESWRIIERFRFIHRLSPAAFHRSFPVSTPSMYRPADARWISFGKRSAELGSP
jgi:hypothetical protein